MVKKNNTGGKKKKKIKKKIKKKKKKKKKKKIQLFLQGKNDFGIYFRNQRLNISIS